MMAGVEPDGPLALLAALLFLGGAAALVAVAIALSQWWDRRDRARRERNATEAERGAGMKASGPCAAAHDAPLAALDVLRDAPSESTTARPTSRRTGALFVGDQRRGAVAPWRPSAARDLGSMSHHAHALSREWTEAESDGLVQLYRVGFRLDEFAAELDVDACSIVEELARRVFSAVDPVAGPGARRFGQPWTATELRTLDSAWGAGLPLPEIARQLGRDQLSVVFRLLEAAATQREADSARRELEVALNH